jgi:REP element-mobilizing transposase RayT
METNGYDLFYQWMHLAYDKGYRFLGYVILPNHVHFISACRKKGN